MKIIFITLILLLPVRFGVEDERVVKEKKEEKKAKGSYSKRLERFRLTPVERAILMVEYGKNVKLSNNPGNLRGKNGYYKFKSFDEGVRKFQKVLNKTYKKCVCLPDTAALRCISRRYAEDYDVWLERTLKRL